MLSLSEYKEELEKHLILAIVSGQGHLLKFYVARICCTLKYKILLCLALGRIN